MRSLHLTIVTIMTLSVILTLYLGLYVSLYVPVNVILSNITVVNNQIYIPKMVLWVNLIKILIFKYVINFVVNVSYNFCKQLEKCNAC